MPYFITDSSPDCSGWATVKEDGEVMGCHTTKQGAIDQALAIAQNEGSEFMGEMRAAPDALKEGDFVRWNSSGGTARGRIEHIMREGTLGVPDSNFSIKASAEDPAALIRIYRQDGEYWEETETLVGHKFSTLTKIEPLPEERNVQPESRAVNLKPPAYMRAAARQGLKYYEEGKGGDGLVERTIREARAMASGSVTADKWVRLRAWIARHLSDLDSPAARPDSADYPSAGVVAHLLWGSGPSVRGAQRALAYAEGVVARLEAENEGRAKGEALSKIETRVGSSEFEVREDDNGMTFEGYAAMFNEPSQPLPFVERIAPGAFTRSLEARNDIKLLWNHDTGSVLGSTRAGTLKLWQDERGLKVQGSLPNTTAGRDAAELIRRGDVDSMSFGFSVPQGGDEWSKDGAQRTLKSVRLHEVSIVAFPAYTSTAGTTSVRGLDSVALRAEVDADALADAMLKVEEGQSLTEDEGRLLKQVVDSLLPVAESVEPEADLGMLELKKKKLALMTGKSSGN
jgi:HK97 family phage prohead protease